MLLGNYNVFNSSPGRAIGGPTDPIIWRKAATTMSYYTGGAVDSNATPKDSFNYGYIPPYTYTLSPSSGGIGSNQRLVGDGDLSFVNLAGGLNGVGPLTGSGDITNAAGTMIIQAAADLAGLGGLTAAITGLVDMVAALIASGDLSADITGSVQAAADLVGLGDLVADIVGGLQAQADLTGSGDITNAAIVGGISAAADLTGAGDLTAAIIGKIEFVAALAGAGDITGALNALAHVVADLTGSGDITAAVPGATAFMTANITVSGTVVTAQDCATAVWESLAASFNNPGTMGEKLNDAGAAGDPWNTALPGAYPDGSAGKILGAKVLTTNKFIALK